jgi:hypothetical protein
MATPVTSDSRGYESQFSANHLGRFQLAARLWTALRNADGARRLPFKRSPARQSQFNDPDFLRHDYERREAYGQ